MLLNKGSFCKGYFKSLLEIIHLAGSWRKCMSPVAPRFLVYHTLLGPSFRYGTSKNDEQLKNH